MQSGVFIMIFSACYKVTNAIENHIPLYNYDCIVRTSKHYQCRLKRILEYLKREIT